MANVPIVSWDETTPAGGDPRSEGDDRIRELKKQTREVIDVDHKMDSSGQGTTWGYHRKATLMNSETVSAGVTDSVVLHCEDDTTAEFYVTDENDDKVQITKDGYLCGSSLDTVSVLALATIYPVGCVYTEITGVNPNTTFGFGTWVAFGAGKVLVGYDSGDTDFDTAEETGGAKTVDISHTHDVRADEAIWGYSGTGIGKIVTNTAESDKASNSPATTAMSDNDTPSIVQPYITVYFWKRTV